MHLGNTIKDWVDASQLDLPFIEETKRVLIEYSSSKSLKGALTKMGWKYQRFASFLQSISRSPRLIFLTPKNVKHVEPDLRLDIIMGKEKISHYYIMRLMQVWIDDLSGKTEIH
ncbi:MAG: hypothetical protein NTV30_08190 [Chloroflexi bacterium]|nr:hypothetical protein [Chloroflexota bacterium]